MPWASKCNRGHYRRCISGSYLLRTISIQHLISHNKKMHAFKMRHIQYQVSFNKIPIATVPGEEERLRGRLRDQRKVHRAVQEARCAAQQAAAQDEAATGRQRSQRREWQVGRRAAASRNATTLARILNLRFFRRNSSQDCQSSGRSDRSASPDNSSTSGYSSPSAGVQSKETSPYGSKARLMNKIIIAYLCTRT